MTNALEPLPLAGTRVVEFAQLVAGPSAALLLADYGAEVIKIEPPEGDNGRKLRSKAASDLPNAPVFVGYNRNKKLIRVDLRTPEGLQTAKELIAQADVLVEASRPGVMARLGLGADALLSEHPRLIYAAISGFGDTEAGRKRGGVDLIIQAESGVMAATGLPEMPIKVGFTIIDAAAGHALCHGILAALLRRERTGMGGVVKTSLYEVALHLQTGPITEYLMTGMQMPRAGNSAPLTAPADLMRCKEGAIVVSAYLEHHWTTFMRLIGGAALLENPLFFGSINRVANRQTLLTQIESLLAARSAAEWSAILAGAGILVGEVKDYAHVTKDPCAIQSGIIEEVGEGFGLRNPVILSGSGQTVLKPREEIAGTSLRFAEISASK